MIKMIKLLKKIIKIKKKIANTKIIFKSKKINLMIKTTIY